MDVILPAITFQHLGNNIAFRWTNSVFYKKLFLHFILIFFLFPPSICGCTGEVHPNRCTLWLGF